MALNDITFQKMSGGIGRATASEDPISGLILDASAITGDTFSSLSEHFDVLNVETSDHTKVDVLAQRIKYPEQLSDYNIIDQVIDKETTPKMTGQELKLAYTLNAIVYHVKEFFRINPEGVLYLMLNTSEKACEGAFIKKLQNYSAGSIRQLGVLTKELNSKKLDDFQLAATELEEEHTPLSLVVTYSGFNQDITTTGTQAPYVHKFTGTPVALSMLEGVSGNLIKKGRCNVSVLIGGDISVDNVLNLGHYAYYGCIGTTLGAISKAKVHESIAWVKSFPLSLELPGFITGDVLNEVKTGTLNALNNNKYIFVRTHVGDANNYFNDSFSLDEPASDYAFIEAVRTIDKACRGVRKHLLPYLNSPLYVDADSGKLSPTTAAFLETTAGRALESMQRAGELSGYKVEIDREQNVLATSKLEVVIKKVGVGVMRRVNIKIGYTTKL